MSDQLHPFIFERLAVRGAVVQLDGVWRSIRGLRSYPSSVEHLLGEALVASALLASTLKNAGGSLLMQMQGDGPLSLMVAECSSEYGLRCTARCRTTVEPAPLPTLLGNGRCAIALGNTEGLRVTKVSCLSRVTRPPARWNRTWRAPSSWKHGSYSPPMVNSRAAYCCSVSRIVRILTRIPSIASRILA